MQKLIKNITAMLLILFISAIVFDYILTTGIKKSKSGYFGEWNTIINGKINSQILICGSSRALVHFDPRIINSMTNKTCYNIGINGTELYMQLARLKTYLKYNNKPEVLIQELDIISLENQNIIYGAEQYAPYLGESYIFTSLVALESDYYIHKYIPLYKYAYFETLKYHAISYFIGYKQFDNLISGYLPQDITWDDTFIKHKYNNPNGVEYKIELKSISILQEIINICKKNSIKVILVYSPEYYENYSLVRNRNKIFDTYLKIATDNNVVFLDFSGLTIFENKDLFYNSQHLNKNGAELFSQLFSIELNRYLHKN